ncbi:MAG TPA: YiiD C-terminal domain-containing protein [Kangiella sp.]|uniref:YiiD C-terminal domain-containing protein n=1 Tax=Kangiella sp. TaxID=1920245 RepID=UPI002F9379F3
MEAAELQQLLYKEIPITQALQIKVDNLTSNSIQVSAPFEANKNIHNTAFAGSIYTTATLAGWSLVTHLVQQRQRLGSVVLASATIRYSKPINGDIVASCKIADPDIIDHFLKRFDSRGRGRLSLEIDVIEAGESKATMQADFAVLRQS